MGRVNYTPKSFACFCVAYALLSLPMRYRHNGHFVNSHRRTSALFPQQQSKHFSRIALLLVIRFSVMLFSSYITGIKKAIDFIDTH